MLDILYLFLFSEKYSDTMIIIYFSCKFFFSQATPPDLQQWTEMAETYDNLTESVSI